MSWFNGVRGYRSHQTLPELVNSYLKSSDTYIAVTETFYLAHVLILSNYIGKAHELIMALYCRPLNEEQYEPLLKEGVSTPEECLAKEQWGQYRESCRTGWMVEHLSVAKPKDPHIWRETDDPVMLAMCSRLLAKEDNQGEYPSWERMREALAAAMKLYAQPQAPVEEGVDYSSTQVWKSRHSFLLYRRLAIELAIRVGELKVASEILSMALRLDGFGRSSGASLQDFLFVPGIYNVLPLLAEGGKDNNPFFIEEEDANTLVWAIIGAVNWRARRGRQWSLPPREAGWKELLERLADGAWRVNSWEYKRLGFDRAADILFPPATEAEIEAVEKDIGELPADFKKMIRVSNGFRGGWQFLDGGMTGIQSITAKHMTAENCAWSQLQIWNSVRDLIVDHVEYIEGIIKADGREDGDD
ncbi:hypothetical protein V496_04394 [Pseudogymnoascus sp. VKM F-4515 (FW-2607)]|nr:hypothetical protein V496_04394 [Pseudogymnoascus sp. VKM F-4515 (FW-2607)]KFY97272.1 hypothetical protein V498_02158 [Pseudogymnoascus sp. VKM F-4517 (FW-2822)]